MRGAVCGSGIAGVIFHATTLSEYPEPSHANSLRATSRRNGDISRFNSAENGRPIARFPAVASITVKSFWSHRVAR